MNIVVAIEIDPSDIEAVCQAANARGFQHSKQRELLRLYFRSVLSGTVVRAKDDYFEVNNDDAIRKE